MEIESDLSAIVHRVKCGLIKVETRRNKLNGANPFSGEISSVTTFSP